MSLRELSRKKNEKEILAGNKQEILRMEKEEALKVLGDKLNEYRNLSYTELVEKVGEPETFEGKNERGEDYRIEIEFFFDGLEETDLRVSGLISYSGWTDFFPASGDFIIAPDGKFVGE